VKKDLNEKNIKKVWDVFERFYDVLVLTKHIIELD
jgi:hypothetical protein